MGTKIKQKAFAIANADMAVPTDNTGFDNYTTAESIVLDYGRDVEGLVKTNGFGQFEINVGGLGLVHVPLGTEYETLTSASGLITPDVSRSYYFKTTLTENTEIQLPDNINAGSYGRPFYILVQQDGTGNWNLTFSATGSRYKPLQGSVGLNLTAASYTLVEVFMSSSIIHPYRMTPINTSSIGLPNTQSALIPFDVTITSAQVLNSNSSPISIIPAPGAGKIAVVTELRKIFIFNTTAYATNTSSFLAYSSAGNTITAGLIDLTSVEPYVDYSIGLSNGSPNFDSIISANEAVVFKTLSGNPTAGDSDIRFMGFYRIIDLN